MDDGARGGRRATQRGAPLGVRARTTAIAAIVVGLVLTAAAVGVVAFIDRALTDQARGVLRARLDDLVSSVDDGVLVTGGSEEEFVQVIVGGEVAMSTENVAGRPPVAELAPGTETVVDDVVAGEGPFLVGAARIDDRTLLVGRSLDDAAEAAGAAARSLAVAVPLLVAVVGAVTWLLVGRALAPIDAMRAEADRISAADLHRRLPVVGTGDEVERLARTLNGMLGRLDDAQRRQRRFVSDASHELRSPIASIRQQAEVARDDPDERVRELADVVLSEVTRLQGLVDDLLLLARLDEDATASKEEVDVDDLVLAEAARLRGLTAARVDTAGVGPGRVQGNARQLARVFRNLADNAERHARSAIALGVAASDGRVVVTVDDDGPGIAPDDRLRVLERFVRLDEGRGRNEGGSGLGLAIVRDVALAHGGRVDLGTSPLGGLRVTVTLPQT